MNKQQILDLLDKLDFPSVFEQIEKIKKEADMIPVLNGLKKEYISPPNNFSQSEFVGRVKVFINSLDFEPEIAQRFTTTFDDYEETVGKTSFNMIFVEGGSFEMGEAPVITDKHGKHTVHVSDFYLAEVVVTQALWKSIIPDVPANIPSNFIGNDLPIVCVSWQKAKIFIQELNALLKKAGKAYSYSLPTEAQWEYAARGGSMQQNFQFAGSNNIGAVANFGSLQGAIRAVKQGFPVHANLPIYDMSGNVWEWCEDVYNEDFYEFSQNMKNPLCTIDDKDEKHKNKKSTRGGAYNSTNQTPCSVWFRNGKLEYEELDFVGFRLCRYAEN